jgi:hypothetical protein
MQEQGSQPALILDLVLALILIREDDAGEKAKVKGGGTNFGKVEKVQRCKGAKVQWQEAAIQGPSPNAEDATGRKSEQERERGGEDVDCRIISAWPGLAIAS